MLSIPVFHHYNIYLAVNLHLILNMQAPSRNSSPSLLGMPSTPSSSSSSRAITTVFKFTIEPKVNSDGHKKLCEVLAPKVFSILLNDKLITKLPREVVRLALDTLQPQERFWGRNMIYSRKRTCEDTFLWHYYDAVVQELRAKVASTS